MDLSAVSLNKVFAFSRGEKNALILSIFGQFPKDKFNLYCIYVSNLK